MFVSTVQQSHLVIHTHTHIYIYIYFKNILFYVMVYPRILGIVPWLNSRILLFIHSICSTVWLLIPMWHLLIFTVIALQCYVSFRHAAKWLNYMYAYIHSFFDFLHIVEKGMATYSSILAWRIPWTEELGGATVHGVTKSGTWLKRLTLSLSHLGHHRAPNVTFKDADLVHWEDPEGLGGEGGGRGDRDGEYM